MTKKNPKMESENKPNYGSGNERALRRLIREPLIHFMLIGSIIYVTYGLFGIVTSDDISEKNTLIVTEGEVAWMEDTWTKRWNRPPTDEERQGLIDQHIQESILYLEAIKMGLDDNDVIIRRRMAQKLRFLQEDLMKPADPEEEVLVTYFNENIDQYIPEEIMTMTQIFFDPDLRDEATLSDAENTKIQLTKIDFEHIDPAKYGDRFMLQNYYPDRTEGEIAKLFGFEFARSVSKLEAGQWHGPILSGYGTHLVFVTSKSKTLPPTLAEVRVDALEDWKMSKQEEINNLFIESLLSRYEITVEVQEETPVTSSETISKGDAG